MQATELPIKNKKLIDNSWVRSKQSFWGYAKTMAVLKNILIPGSCLGKSRFAKRFARRINIINGKKDNSIYTAQRQKMERHMISLIQSISKYKMTPSWWHRCNIIWFQELLNVFDKDNITKISSHDTQTVLSHYIITKASKIKLLRE